MRIRALALRFLPLFLGGFPAILSGGCIAYNGSQHDFDLPIFPWPPPRASAIEIIPRALLELKHDQTHLADVDRGLNVALYNNGYWETRYFAVPQGFALVTQLEQIEPDGASQQDPQRRWAAGVRPLQTFSLTHYFSALFRGRPGYYRVIVFVVTPHEFVQSDAVITPAEADKWLLDGVHAFPKSLGALEFSEGYTCTALIYEFERKSDAEAPRLRQPGRIPGHVHLVKAGIWEVLQQWPR